MSQIAEHLTQVRARIDAAARAVGRDPGSVRLLPVSKTHPVGSIREARDAGYDLFGENKVQEMVAKSLELEADEGIGFALIGHLQSNKARAAAQVAREFQALDSLKLARALDRHADEFDRTIDVYVQVNSSGEEQKFGLAPEAVAGFAAQLGAFERLRVVGLMTLAVFSDDAARVGACFERTVEVQRRLRDDGVGGLTWDELSMGMSGDFELAIAHGATVVRVGEAIFGARLRPQDYWPGAS